MALTTIDVPIPFASGFSVTTLRELPSGTTCVFAYDLTCTNAAICSTETRSIEATAEPTRPFASVRVDRRETFRELAVRSIIYYTTGCEGSAGDPPSFRCIVTTTGFTASTMADGQVSSTRTTMFETTTLAVAQLSITQVAITDSAYPMSDLSSCVLGPASTASRGSQSSQISGDDESPGSSSTGSSGAGGGGRRRKGVIEGGAAAGAFVGLAILISLILMIRQRRRKKKAEESPESSQKQNQRSSTYWNRKAAGENGDGVEFKIHELDAPSTTQELDNGQERHELSSEIRPSEVGGTAIHELPEKFPQST